MGNFFLGATWEMLTHPKGSIKEISLIILIITGTENVKLTLHDKAKLLLKTFFSLEILVAKVETLIHFDITPLSLYFGLIVEMLIYIILPILLIFVFLS